MDHQLRRTPSGRPKVLVRYRVPILGFGGGSLAESVERLFDVNASGLGSSAPSPHSLRLIEAFNQRGIEFSTQELGATDTGS